MDLIDREKAREEVFGYDCAPLLGMMPSAFDGMTNGEVTKAVFSNVQFYETGKWIHMVFNGMDYSFCPVDFWNSPYQGGRL